MWPIRRNSQNSVARIVGWTSVQCPQDCHKKGKVVWCTISSIQAVSSWGDTLVFWDIGHLSSQEWSWRFFQELLFCIAKRILLKEAVGGVGGKAAYKISEFSAWLPCQIQYHHLRRYIDAHWLWAFAFLPSMSVLCLPKYINCFLF